MTLVKVKNRPFDKNFNIFMDDFFHRFPSLLKEDLTLTTARWNVPVNIKETENAYRLEVVAPGFEKDDFKVNLEAALLTISAEKKEETAASNEKTIQKEFATRSFKRSFSVDETIDTDNIRAEYVKGILTLNLPKKETVKPATKEISVQ